MHQPLGKQANSFGAVAIPLHPYPAQNRDEPAWAMATLPARRKAPVPDSAAASKNTGPAEGGSRTGDKSISREGADCRAAAGGPRHDA